MGTKVNSKSRAITTFFGASVRHCLGSVHRRLSADVARPQNKPV